VPQTRRVTISVTEEQHAAWRQAAAREGVSLAEYVRRSADEHTDEGIDGPTPSRLRWMIAHLQTMLSHAEKPPELGVAGLMGCYGCHGIFSHALHHLVLTPLL